MINSIEYKKIRPLVFLCIVGLVLYFLPYQDPLFQAHDNIPTALMPISILKEWNFNLNEFEEGKEKLRYYNSVDDTQYYLEMNSKSDVISNFPIMNGVLLTVPYLVFAISHPQLFSATSMNNLLIIQANYFSAVIITVFTCAILFRLFTYLKYPTWIRYLGVTLFVFGTLVVNTSSRFVWQHTFALFFLSLSILLYEQKKLWFCLLSCVIAVMVRPPTIVLVLPLLFYLIVKKMKERKLELSLQEVITIGIVALLIFFQFYYAARYLDWQNLFAPQYKIDRFFNFPISGILGILVSPARGILFFSPIFLLSIYEMIYSSVVKKSDQPYLFSTLFFVLLIGCWGTWYGGWSNSYRLLSELIPVFILFLCKFLTRIHSYSRIIKLFVIICVIFSMYANFVIGTFYGDCGFNEFPISIDDTIGNEKTKRLWLDSSVFRCTNHFIYAKI